MGNARCKVDGCEKSAEKTGLCGMHYQRKRLNGSVHVRKKAANGEVLAYFETVVLAYEGDECLIWPYGKNAQGYAVLGREGLASRVLCKRAKGAAPTPKHEAAHTCGNGASGCVTKKHLVWKTRAENEADKLLHGTHNRGSRSGNAKLTETDVAAIRRLLGSRSMRSIAKEFGVGPSTISDIRDGKRWAWLKEAA